MANAAVQIETLKKAALGAFNYQSSLLEATYPRLRDQWAAETQKLAVKQTAWHREMLEKERHGSRLEWMLEALPSAIIVIDGDGFIMEHNSKSSAFLNMPLLDCAWSVIVQREFCPGEGLDGELKLKDGRWLSLSRQSLECESGEMLVLTDITESRERSELLERHQRLSCIGEMTARLGHQFRTPLAAALLYASQLDNPTFSDRKNIAAKIMSRLKDLAGMMDDMLRYAAGARRSGESVKVVDLLKNVADTIGSQPDSKNQLIVDVADPDLVIEVNCTAVKGALLNLVNNAFQACKDSPRVELGAVRSKNQICLTVTDNGAGVGEDIRSRIFDPFFTTRPQGTGLGLAVVRSVAEAHNGEVLVDSGPTGTTFAFCIPAAEKKSEAEKCVESRAVENCNV